MIGVSKSGCDRGRYNVYYLSLLDNRVEDGGGLVQSRPRTSKKQTEKQDSEVPIRGCIKGIHPPTAVSKRGKLTPFNLDHRASAFELKGRSPTHIMIVAEVTDSTKIKMDG
jgi:hypothetical protein